MALFIRNKKRVGLISGKPKGKDIFSPKTLAKGFVLGLETGGYAGAKGILASKKFVSKALQPKFRPISVKKALEMEAKERGLNKKKVQI